MDADLFAKVVDNLLKQVNELKASKGLLQGGSADLIYRMLEDDWQWQLQDNPEYATQAGQHQYDGKLQDISPGSFETRAAHDRELLVKAEALLAKATANSPDDISTLHLRLFVQDVHDELRAFSLGCHLYPVNSIGYGGVHNNFLEALDWLPATLKGDMDFISRLEAFPKQCSDYKDLLRHGISLGKLASCDMLRKVEEQLEALATQVHAVDCEDCGAGPLFNIADFSSGGANGDMTCVACASMEPQGDCEGPIKQRVAKLLTASPEMTNR
jgi:uncharacterized protein (DUF885 family)